MKKILIANRGEIALRIIRTVKEMGIKTVSVYSTADKDSIHVHFADESVCIGPPNPIESYLNIPKLISAAEITNSDAIHPGYGFLSESSYFSLMCNKHNILFIGSNPNNMKKMENKILAKKHMLKAGISCIPGSECFFNSSYKEIEKISDKIGYPIIIKSVFGGGGKGIRSVFEKKYLKESWEKAKKESFSCFGKNDLYIEKLILNSRHIEVQIIGDKYGNISHLSERDCSIQRRNQKLLEETPSPFLNSSIRKKICNKAKNIAKYIDFIGIGTVEFLIDNNKNYYFIEINPRIQVEHAITEEAIGIDLIYEQISMINGEKNTNKDLFPKMHSIECRINAENPYKNFRPDPGKITHLHIPGGKGVRIDTHIYSGYNISHYYDSMIAKIITTENNRKKAIMKMLRSLEEFVVEGIFTTIPFQKKIIKNNDFLKGNYDINFIKKIM